MEYAASNTTYFGRYHYVHLGLRRGVLPVKPTRVLVVGPGRTKTYVEGRTRDCSFEPYEIANTLERCGIADYSIETIDREPAVLRSVRNTVTVIAEQEGMNFSVPAHYVYGFFPEHAIRISGGAQVTIPESVRTRVFARQQVDVFAEGGLSPTPGHELVWCVNVLPHARPFDRQRAENTGEKLVAALNKDGILVTEAIFPFSSHPGLRAQRVFPPGERNKFPIGIFFKE